MTSICRHAGRLHTLKLSVENCACQQGGFKPHGVACCPPNGSCAIPDVCNQACAFMGFQDSCSIAAWPREALLCCCIYALIWQWHLQP